MRPFWFSDQIHGQRPPHKATPRNKIQSHNLLGFIRPDRDCLANSSRHAKKQNVSSTKESEDESLEIIFPPAVVKVDKSPDLHARQFHVIPSTSHQNVFLPGMGNAVKDFFSGEKPCDSYRQFLRRMLFVPLGHTIIAHRFIGGIECRIGRKAPQGAKDLHSRIAILKTFVVSIDNLSSLSGLDLSTGHSPTVETVGYCRASQRDEEPRSNPLTMATFCLHKNCFEPLFSRRKILHGVA